MRHLRVCYHRPSELRADLDGQLVHGGLLVKVSKDTLEGVSLRSQIPIEIVLPSGDRVHGVGEVLHLATTGVALGVPKDLVDKLRDLAGKHQGPDPQGALPSAHEVVQAEVPPQTPPKDPEAPPTRERSTKDLAEVHAAEKIQRALHGTQEERTAILRDKNRMLHPYVLRNPQIGLDEILAIAKSPMSGADLLQIIASNKDWLQKPQIALALVKNPKTPQGAGVRALDYVNGSDLRLLAKGTGIPPHILNAARKKVLT